MHGFSPGTLASSPSPKTCFECCCFFVEDSKLSFGVHVSVYVVVWHCDRLTPIQGVPHLHPNRSCDGLQHPCELKRESVGLKDGWIQIRY